MICRVMVALSFPVVPGLIQWLARGVYRAKELGKKESKIFQPAGCSAFSLGGMCGENGMIKDAVFLVLY
jgi:hypothetical protein